MWAVMMLPPLRPLSATNTASAMPAMMRLRAGKFIRSGPVSKSNSLISVPPLVPVSAYGSTMHAVWIRWVPSNIIFNNGSGTQTSDLVFANGGYYNEAGALQGVVTGIQLTTIKAIDNKLQRVYTIDGHLLRVLPAGTSINDALNQLGHGVYIINGKKVTK